MKYCEYRKLIGEFAKTFDERLELEITLDMIFSLDFYKLKVSDTLFEKLCSFTNLCYLKSSISNIQTVADVIVKMYLDKELTEDEIVDCKFKVVKEITDRAYDAYSEEL